MNATAFQLCRPQVVAEEVDGEVIAINLETGAYFSFRDSASDIWQRLIVGPASPEELVAGLCAPPARTEEVERAVGAFLRRMESEGLLESVTAPREDLPAWSASTKPFQVPTYEKYTDMEDFLLVDPIHDLDVSEWPDVTSGGAEAGERDR